MPYETFEASDGYVNLAIGNDEQFVRFCREAGRDDLADDTRFQTNRNRVIEREALVAELQATIATRTVAEWVAILDRAAAPGGPVLTLPQVFDGPAAHMVETVEHPTAGPLRLVRSPVGIDGERPSARRHPPRLGEHTAEVLTEAGYSPEEVADLLAGACAAG